MSNVVTRNSDCFGSFVTATKSIEDRAERLIDFAHERASSGKDEHAIAEEKEEEKSADGQ